jgi:hypothetical protein
MGKPPIIIVIDPKPLSGRSCLRRDLGSGAGYSVSHAKANAATGRVPVLCSFASVPIASPAGTEAALKSDQNMHLFPKRRKIWEESSRCLTYKSTNHRVDLLHGSMGSPMSSVFIAFKGPSFLPTIGFRWGRISA